MRISMVALGVMCTVALLAGCASSPVPKQSSVRWVAPPTAGTDHPPMIDMTYKNQHPPRYPLAAIAAHHQGTAVLDVFVNAQGGVSKVEVQKSSGYPELDASAAAAAQHWLYMAGMQHGEPYASVVRVPVTFSM